MKRSTSFEFGAVGYFSVSYIILLILIGMVIYAQPSPMMIAACILCAVLTVLAFVLFYCFSRRRRERAGEGHMNQSVSMDFLRYFALPALLIDDEGQILWTNETFCDLTGQGPTALYEANLSSFCAVPLPSPLSDFLYGEEANVSIFETPYRILPYTAAAGMHLCVLLDRSECAFLEHRLHMKNPLVMFLAVDNVTDDPTMSAAGYRTVLNRIYPLLEEWAGELDGILREFGRDRYLLLLEEEKLSSLRDGKFEILDRVRALSEGVVDVPVTISAGIAEGDGTLHEKELASYQALDTALQRGGDQVVLKDREGTLEYYGGRTKTVQKRSRIRSRIVAGELKNLVLANERVLIMGHAAADHDCLGACIGLARFCMELSRPVNIIVNMADPNVKPILQLLSGLCEYEGVFLDAASAQDLVSPTTLLIIADVNNARTFESPALYENCANVVIIDHHRKTSEFIVQPKITYIDPACSSTCEMVSEILEQSLERGRLKKEEADVMFAGIMLDTKQFTRNTGTRTFAAALYLRDVDASPTRAQRLFSTDLDMMLSELEFEKNVVIYRDVIAIAASNRAATFEDKIAASRAADRLLNLKNIQATFVLCKIDDCTHISARSAGQVNVQLILERLHGGGYFDAAGAQLKGFDFTQALELLKQSIDEYLNAE